MNIGASGLSPEEAKARVLNLQRKLHKWSKADQNKRFCDLWNLVCDPATLQVAWLRVKSNKGSRTAGIDRMTRYEVERQGEGPFLEKIRSSLKDGSFRPLAVRERGVPKKGGKIRYLGIPTLQDRVVQAALKLVLEPILDPGFYSSSYGYRPGRRTQDAIAEIVHFGNPPSTYEWVIEADIEACFDQIDRGTIMSEVEKRIGDRRVLRLLRAFLQAGVMTEGGHLERRLTGTPQGGIISPLLANVALGVLDREFERRWELMGGTYRRKALRMKGLPTYRLVRFADDFVIILKGTRQHADAVMAELPEILNRIGLKLSLTKTRLTHIDEGFEFLGVRLIRKPRTGKKPCVYTFVSNEALASVKRKVKALTSRSSLNLSLRVLISMLNPILRGWAQHFRFAAASRTFSYLGHYVWWRVAHWLRKKHKDRSWKWLFARYGLHGSPSDSGVVLYNPQAMRIVRYRYRGSKIATPWEEIDSPAPGHRQMAFDEIEFLGALQESLVG